MGPPRKEGEIRLGVDKLFEMDSNSGERQSIIRNEEINFYHPVVVAASRLILRVFRS